MIDNVRHHAGRDIMRQRRVTILVFIPPFLGNSPTRSAAWLPLDISHTAASSCQSLFPIAAHKNIRQARTAVSAAITWECEISGLSCRVDEIFALLGCCVVRLAQ